MRYLFCFLATSILVFPAPRASAIPVEVTITGNVSAVIEGGWSNVPPLGNDVSVGDAFTATMTFDSPGGASYWYNDPWDADWAEDRWTWNNSLTDLGFSTGTLSGGGPGGKFYYHLTEEFTDDWQVSDYHHYSQVRQDYSTEVNFGDGTKTSTGHFYYTLEAGYTPSIGGCSLWPSPKIGCLMNAVGWDTRSANIGTGQRGTVLANITDWTVVPEPASGLLALLGISSLLTIREKRTSL